MGYAGKRVIVIGAATRSGAATTAILVDLGAEVHTVDLHKPDVSGLASFTEADPFDTDVVEHAARKIGSVVNGLFVCVVVDDLARIVDAVVPLTVTGAAIVAVVPEPATDALAYVRDHADVLSADGVRINAVVVSGETPDESVAWPLVLLNSVRAAALTGNLLSFRGGSVSG